MSELTEVMSGAPTRVNIKSLVNDAGLKNLHMSHLPPRATINAIARSKEASTSEIAQGKVSPFKPIDIYSKANSPPCMVRDGSPASAESSQGHYLMAVLNESLAHKMAGTFSWCDVCNYLYVNLRLMTQYGVKGASTYRKALNERMEAKCLMDGHV